MMDDSEVINYTIVVKNGSNYENRFKEITANGFVDGFTVNHKDGDFKNNRADNLEWLSRADNIRDGLRTGLYNNIRKGVRLISEDSNTLVFQSMRDASRYLGKCDGYVSGAIARGRTVRDLSGNRYSAIPF